MNALAANSFFMVLAISGGITILCLTALLFYGVGCGRTEARLSQAVQHDSLTGLGNRILFIDRVTMAIARSKRSAAMGVLMFIDLDDFKLVNDTFGHDNGDRVLKTVADRMVSCAREVDTVARIGGDEFSVLIEGITSKRDAAIAGQRIVESVARPIALNGREVTVKVSIGIAIYDQDTKDIDTPLKQADLAMYQAKKQGGNMYQFYTNGMNAQLSERLTLESDLKHAIAAEEFIVYYQPQADLRSGQVVGMEALVRWQHPERGLVSPDTFIFAAEETGMIIPIGEMVMRSACTQNRLWHEGGLAPLHMAVNLSGRQFRQPDLVSSIARIVNQARLDPNFLEVEVTESFLVDDVQKTIAILLELKAMGIKIAIDDFGMGYSSFRHLKDFPIDIVKIDQFFIRDITSSSKAFAMTAGIISLAHSLGLTVVAEGVETTEQRDFLRTMDCDVIQGYLLSRPLPAEDIEWWLREHRRALAAPESDALVEDSPAYLSVASPSHSDRCHT